MDVEPSGASFLLLRGWGPASDYPGIQQKDDRPKSEKLGTTESISSKEAEFPVGSLLRSLDHDCAECSQRMPMDQHAVCQLIMIRTQMIGIR